MIYEAKPGGPQLIVTLDGVDVTAFSFYADDTAGIVRMYGHTKADPLRVLDGYASEFPKNDREAVPRLSRATQVKRFHLLSNPRDRRYVARGHVVVTKKEAE